MFRLGFWKGIFSVLKRTNWKMMARDKELIQRLCQSLR